MIDTADILPGSSIMQVSSVDVGLALLVAHLIGDFWLQTGRMAKEKRLPGVLLSHVAVVTALSYLLVARWSAWPIAGVIAVTHFALDFMKARLPNRALIFCGDQFGHLVVIAALAWFAPQWNGDLSFWTSLGGRSWWIVLIVLSGFTLSVRVGGFLIGFWVQPYLEEIKDAAGPADMPLKPTRGLTNGGRLIGQWERALIFLFVGLGQPGSIGFLIAAKSIFRFGELKDRENRMEAEYITIGTLMSFGWAMAVSYPTWWAVRALW